VVFNVKLGDVLTARKYPQNMIGGYRELVKSIIVSSEPYPMAYVLSNNDNDISSP
jgi:hypothetical protein